MKRLSSAESSNLPEMVQRPQYDRDKIKAGIVHIGIGAFHRAHQATYTEDVLNMEQGGDWAIIGASLRSAGVRDQLSPQDGLYTVLERDSDNEKIRLVGAVKDVLVGPEDPERLIKAIADPNIKIVSLTITEKGYYFEPATGKLLITHPDVRHDLDNPDRPKTVLGYLFSALKIRHREKQPLTLMSCDNLPENGKILKEAILSFATLQSPDLALWINDNCSFPCSMVDRIVPATTEEDRQSHSQRITMQDQALVVSEPFRQWVIEDNFASGRPAWEKAGALLVGDVQYYEEMKLRLLNGSHSAIAYLGFMAGYEYIYEAIQNNTLARYIKKLMDEEVTPSLTLPENINLEDYKNTILKRFANTTVKYKTSQVAMDGSQKLPQRWLSSLRHQLDNPGKSDLLCLAIASWIRYLKGIDETGTAYNYNDPLAPTLSKLTSQETASHREIVTNLLSVQDIFGEDLGRNDRLISRITYWLDNLYEIGTLKSVEIAIRN